jgi:hypothetical protein
MEGTIGHVRGTNRTRALSGAACSPEGPAEQAASSLQPKVRGDSVGIQVLGQLTLTVALAATVVQDGSASACWLDVSDELVGRVPDDPARGWHCFSKTNVSVWRVTTAVECGKPAVAC